MMRSGAPPDKVGVLHLLLPIEFHGFTSRINSKGYHSLVPGVISIFIDGMGPFNASKWQFYTVAPCMHVATYFIFTRSTFQDI